MTQIIDEKTITIPEYSSVELEGDDINEKIDLSYLKKDCFRYNTSNPPYKITLLRDNKIKIENTSYSGVIQLENSRIYFSTKVKTNLFYMLSFLKDESCFHYDSDRIIEIKEGANFFDILGKMFLNELQVISKRGFYKSYLVKEENLKFFKGKLIINENIKNAISKNTHFYCSYRDLTFNNLENQILLRTITLLIPLIRFNEKTKKELLRYENLLKDTISLVNLVPEDCNKIQYSRLNEYYNTIIQFSKVILQNYFIRSSLKGESRGFNFIVNMNKVYEDFISTIIEEIVVEEEELKEFIVERQEIFNNLVKERKIITRPDIILRKKGPKDDYPIIIDTKYKMDRSNADYYQVIAYALAIPTAKACFLIYPESEKNLEDILTIDTFDLENKRPEIKIYSINIDIDINENVVFGEYIRKIKKILKEKLVRFL